MKEYNVHITPHHRTSLWVWTEKEVGFPVMVIARNKKEAQELASAMVADWYEIEQHYTTENAQYLAKQYKYRITYEG